MSRYAPSLVLFAACSGSPPAPPAEVPVTGSVTAPAAPAAPAVDVYTLQNITNGDVACYLDLLKADGSLTVYPSDYRFCPGGEADAASLVGKKVTATFEKINVLASECQGNPDCGKSEVVEGVATLTPAM